MISLVIETLFVESPAPYALFIWPPFAFYRALGLMNRGTLTATSIPYKFSRLGPSDELFAAMQFLIFEIPIVLGAAYYLGNVFPSDFGVKKPLNFPFINAKKWWLNRKGSPDGKINDEEILATNIVISEEETQYEDSDVKAERAKVLDPEFDAKNYTIAMSNMRKVYAGRGGAAPKLAVKDVTLAVEPNTTFGLLGPNGAGKTTLISILTGLYEASTGKARIAGYDIKADTDQVYKVVGICPQFDIQWDELTVGEHLYFYARLKGIIPSHERKAVKYALESVALLKFENRLTKGLSGGERRRLSIAIALLGEPKVVFLDEPTVITFNQTGLDPEVRRLIWNIVNEARAGRTVVLVFYY